MSRLENAHRNISGQQTLRDTERATSEELRQIQKVFDSLIGETFPREVAHFKTPGIPRLVGDLQEWKEHQKGGRTAHGKAGRVLREAGAPDTFRQIVAAAIVRHVDEFIDTALWPRLGTYEKDELRGKFDNFLHQALSLAQKYDPQMPDQIIRLPQLELDLTLNPTQENFNAKIVELFEHKSFDLMYLHSLISGRSMDTITDGWRLKHVKNCLNDFLRDFEKKNYKKEKDFNLRNFIVTYAIDPRVLIEYLNSLMSVFGGTAASGDFSRKDSKDAIEVCGNMKTLLLNAHLSHESSTKLRSRQI